MKRATLLLIVIAFPICMFSQNFGIQGGGSLSDMIARGDLYTWNTKLKPAFFAGITVEFPLKNTMAINTALNLKHAGTWIRQDLDILAVRLNYINFDFTYDYIFNFETFRLYAEGGGYLAYAAWGKWAFKPEDGDTEFEDIKIGTSDEDEIKPFDAGLIIGTGVYLGKFKLGLTYNQGLLNLSTIDSERLRNMTFSLKAAYFFNM